MVKGKTKSSWEQRLTENIEHIKKYEFPHRLFAIINN